MGNKEEAGELGAREKSSFPPVPRTLPLYLFSIPNPLLQ